MKDNESVIRFAIHSFYVRSDIKQQVEVLNETLNVLPDTRGRLQKYATELSKFFEENDIAAILEEDGAGGEGETKEGDENALLKQAKEGKEILLACAEALPDLEL